MLGRDRVRELAELRRLAGLTDSAFAKETVNAGIEVCTRSYQLSLLPDVTATGAPHHGV